MMEESDTASADAKSPLPPLESAGAIDLPAMPAGDVTEEAAPTPVATMEAESGIKEVDGKGAIARLVQEGKPTSTFESTMMGWFSTVTDVVADVAENTVMAGQMVAEAGRGAAETGVAMAGGLAGDITQGKFMLATKDGLSTASGYLDKGAKVAEQGLSTALGTALDATSGTLAAMNVGGPTGTAGINVVVTSTDRDIVDAVKLGLQQKFGMSAALRGVDSETDGPEQLVGIEAAKTSAKARIAGVVTKPEEVVLNVENFLMEVSSGSSGSSAETWVDTHLLTLHDSANNVEMVQLSQPVEVPIKYIYAARKETPTDYEFWDAGLAVSCGMMMAEDIVALDRDNWTKTMAGVSKEEIIAFAVTVVFGQYRRRLIEATREQTRTEQPR